MNGESLEVLFGANFHAIQVNLNGLTHEDSLVQPQPAGNCLNWVLGHIVGYRNEILQMLGKEPIWTDEERAPYKRGSKPLTDPRSAMQLKKIMQDFGRSQELLIGALRGLTAEDLKQGELGEKVSWLQFHEAYHAGQIGLLRRLTGKEGMIR